MLKPPKIGRTLKYMAHLSHREQVLDLELTIVRSLRHTEDPDLRIAAAEREKELELELSQCQSSSTKPS